MSTCRIASPCGRTCAVFGRLYGVASLRRRIGELARKPRARAVSRSARRQPFGRPEDPRRAGQGADQRARGAAARRADRLARSGHRRLGSRPARGLPARRAARRSCSPRTTWARSSACATASSCSSRAGSSTTARPRTLHRALRPREPRGGVSRRRARPRIGAADMSLAAATLTGFSPARVGAMVDALSLSPALVLAAPRRTRLLAGGADDDLGVPADLHPRAGRGFRRRAARWRSPAER